MIYYAGQKIIYEKGEVDEQIADVTAMMESADIDKVSAVLTELQTTVSNTLSEYSDKLDAFQETIDGAVSTAESALSATEALQTTVSSINDAVAALQSDVSTLQSSVSQLELRIAAAESDIADMKDEIEAIKDEIAGVFTVKGSAKYITESAVDETFTEAGLWQETGGTWTLVTEISAGDVYNLLEDITTDDGFLEGAGNNVSAGTNVVFVNAGTEDEPVWKLDVLALSITSVEMDAETAAREAAIAELQSQLSAETTRAEAAESALQDSLTTEASERQSADSELQTSIEAEVTRATNAESALQTALTTEESARADADSSLQSQIDELGESKAEVWTGDAAEFESEKDSIEDGTLVLSESDLNH